ncbi:MAG: 2-C-methyl-D-erythritol 2,4-cyclodiphosphate synthase [Acidimicrobiia bacterium]
MYLGTDVRVGWGYDVHRFDDAPPLVLAGVVVDESRGMAATSDGDVVAHAVVDAVLGAAGLGDIGHHFPSNDPRWAGADSMAMVRHAAMAAHHAGWYVAGCDVTVVAETVRISPHRQAMVANLGDRLGVIEVDSVSVKATTTDGLGFTGRDEGIAATAVAVLRSLD